MGCNDVRILSGECEYELIRERRIGMGFVHNYTELLVTRIFLGLTEAGLFPGVSYFLTLWYRRFEINLRIALFFSAATLAGAFGGLLGDTDYVEASMAKF